MTYDKRMQAILDYIIIAPLVLIASCTKTDQQPPPTKVAPKVVSQGIHNSRKPPVVRDGQGIVVARLGGHFVDLVRGVYFTEGAIQVEVGFDPKLPLAKTTVGTDGRFYFEQLRLPGGMFSLRGRTKSGKWGLSDGYDSESLLKGVYNLDSFDVMFNPWNPPVPVGIPTQANELAGEVRGLVIDRSTGKPIQGAILSMKVTSKCGGPSSAWGEGDYSVITDSAGQYVITKPALHKHFFAEVSDTSDCGIGEIKELSAEAPGFKKTVYSPQEASSFGFLPNHYRRDFTLQPIDTGKPLQGQLPDSAGIHPAARNGNAASVTGFLDSGVSVDAMDELHRTPLHWAALEGRLLVIRVLLQHGASVGASDVDGNTPLHLAASKGQTESCLLLIGSGADINLPNNTGWTPLVWSIIDGSGHEATAKLLISKGARVNQFNEQYTPLHWAASKGLASIAKLLIARGADVNAQENGGITPLQAAAARGSTEGTTILLDAGALPNRATSHGLTALHFAAIEGKDSVAKVLIGRHANVNALEDNGDTPLHEALTFYYWADASSAENASRKASKVEIVRMLINAGADINARNKEGETPMVLAQRFDMSEAGALLKAKK